MTSRSSSGRRCYGLLMGDVSRGGGHPPRLPSGRCSGCVAGYASGVPGSSTATGAGLATASRPDLAARIVELATTRYEGVNDCHLAELLAEDEGIIISRSSLRACSVRPGGRPAPVGHRASQPAPAHAPGRPAPPGRRQPLMPGSRPGAHASPSSAPSTTPPGAFVAATFRAVEDTAAISRSPAHAPHHGRPALTLSPSSRLFAPSARVARSRDTGTQLGRAFAELGITSIPALAPGQGSFERPCTFQDRLCPSFVSPRPTTSRAPTRSSPGSSAGSMPTSACRTLTSRLRPAPAARELARICAFRWRRFVGNDNTVRVEGAVLQLPPTYGGRGLAGRRVEVELHLDGRVVVVDRGRTLLIVPVSPDPDQLREITLLAPTGPAPAPGGAQRPGYPPRPDHPWNRPGPKAPSRGPLTQSLSR